jgi:hypothetical protein
MKQAGGSGAGVISPARAIAEVRAFERLEAAQQPLQWGWLAKTGGFLLSAGVCALSFGVTISWQIMLILLGLLLLHELGHVAGMILCGYRDRQILFVPFLGAVTRGKKEGPRKALCPRSGRKDDASPSQKLLVYFFGPVPGIILGFAAVSLASLQGSLLWHNIGVLAIILNYLEGVSELWICYPLQTKRHPNRSEGSDDYPNAALSLLPRDRYRPAWQVA